MIERLKAMLIKEFIQIFRDPRMRSIIFLVPIIQTLVFGYAVTMDVKNAPIAIYDLDNTPLSRELTDSFIHTGYFYIAKRVENEKGVAEVLDKGTAFAVIRFNKGFEEKIKAEQSALLQILLDGTDSNTAGIVFDYLSRIANQFSQNIQSQRMVHFPKTSSIVLESRAWFNPNLESRNFYVPGVVAILITLMTLILTSMAIVREKEVGTMEQIIVSPITKVEFILGKTIPFILIGFIDIALILCVAVFWFEVPVHGNPALLFLGASLYLLTTLGIGLFISTISQTQQQAMMSAFLFYMPAVLLSGFIFPIANMPTVIQFFTFFNPLKYFLIVIRGVFLRGVGISILWPQLLVMGLMGIFILWLASQRFRKTMA